MKNFFAMAMVFGLTTFSTHAAEPSGASEAATLLQGTTSDGFLSQTDLVRIDRELAAIRAAFPEAQEVHARSLWVPNRLVVTLKGEAQNLLLTTHSDLLVKVRSSLYQGAWDQYTLESFQTGIDDLDALNDWMGVVAVHVLEIGQGAATSVSLNLEFSGDLDMKAVADRYQALNSVSSATPSYYFGDGSNVYFTQGLSNGVDGFVFKTASGDCPAGCINRSYQYFTVERTSLRVTRVPADSKLAQRMRKGL